MSENYITAALAAGAVIITGALSSLVTLIISRRPAEVTAEAAAQDAVNEGFAALMAQVMKQNADLAKELTEARGEIRQVIQHLESLEKILREQGLPIPPRIWEVAAFKPVTGPN